MTSTRPRAVLVVATLVLVGGLVALAQALLGSQQQAREDVERRFADRAAVTASLTESIFSSSAVGAQADHERRFGGRRVDPRALEELRRESRIAYAVVLDGGARVIATAGEVPAGTAARLQRRPAHVQAVLGGRPFALTDVRDRGRGATPVVEYASTFDAPVARRVLIQAFDPRIIAPLLGGYLGRLPGQGASSAYVLDSAGIVVGAPDGRGRPGRVVDVPGLARALRRARGTLGTFDSAGTARTFVSRPVPDTSWQVVLTARDRDLYASVSGAERWIPWVILGALAVTGALAILLLRRTLADAEAMRRSNRQLERRAAELQRSNAELEQFAYVASHDLQEPLRKVQAFGDLLASRHADALPDPAQDYLRRMRNAAGRMSRLIDDLLVFSRVSTNTRPFERLDLTRVAQDVTQDLEAQIGAAGADVHVTRLPVVDADPLQMRQLLQNLVSNAVKFRSDDRAPTVRIDGRTDDGCAVVTVADDGIGFEDRYADRVFRVFERLHGRDEYEGTGIGLALCRKIAERHGGSITASSTPGQGTTMTIRLPLRHPDAEPASGDPEPTPREHLTHA